MWKSLRPLGFLALELPRDNIHQYLPSAIQHIVSLIYAQPLCFGQMFLLQPSCSWLTRQGSAARLLRFLPHWLPARLLPSHRHHQSLHQQPPPDLLPPEQLQPRGLQVQAHQARHTARRGRRQRRTRIRLDLTYQVFVLRVFLSRHGLRQYHEEVRDLQGLCQGTTELDPVWYTKLQTQQLINIKGGLLLGKLAVLGDR